MKSSRGGAALLLLPLLPRLDSPSLRLSGMVSAVFSVSEKKSSSEDSLTIIIVWRVLAWRARLLLVLEEDPLRLLPLLPLLLPMVPGLSMSAGRGIAILGCTGVNAEPMIYGFPPIIIFDSLHERHSAGPLDALEMILFPPIA